MKALKEKRNSIRSLWRMGLVILSVFALSFVACADSGGEGGTPPGGGAIAQKIPVSITVATPPIESTVGPVHEGMVISPAGIVLNVTYSDGTYDANVTDINRITIAPSIYDARVGLPASALVGELAYLANDYPNGFYPNGYELTYTTESGHSAKTYIKFDNIRRLLGLNITGTMVKRDYKIDDIVDFTGLTVEGIYSHSAAANLPPTQLVIPAPADANGDYAAPPGWAEMADYYSLSLPLTSKNPDYKWAWVQNKSPGVGSFIDDRPGVLISIGSYGKIYSKIRGEGAPTEFDDVILRGTRRPIDHLYQVTKLEWIAGTGQTVFYDDPTLISAVSTEAELATRMKTWTDKAFTGAQFKLTYEDGGSNTFSLGQLQTMNINYAKTLGNYGWGGTWANLEIFPVSNDGYRIDVTRDNKPLDANVPSTAYFDFNWLNQARDEFTDGANAQYLNGTIGWAQWAQQNYGRSKMRFYWRDAAYDLPVLIYNVPQTVTVTGKAAGVVELSGADYVYKYGAGMNEFLNKVTVAVTYGVQGTLPSGVQATQVRSDVAADIAKGVCRAAVVYNDDNKGADYDPTLPPNRIMPTLYSPGIWNFRDNTEYTGTGLGWGGDLQAAQGWMDFNSLSTAGATTWEDAVQTSLLNRSTTTRYGSGKGVQRARVYYVGWAGNPTATRARYGQLEAGVGPKAYAFDWDDTPLNPVAGLDQPQWW